MAFEHYIPCVALQPYLKSLAISELEDEGNYKVLPDTGLVIGFQYKGQLSHIDGKKEIQLSASGITGLQDQYRIFKNSANIGTVLVFFKDMGATAFFKLPLHELFRESVSLDNFMLRSELLIVEEQLYAAQDAKERIVVVENFLISRIKPVSTDPLVCNALALIHKNKGNIRVTELIKLLHTSPSPLEKRFRQAVGTSLKKFASIVRLKHVLQTYHSDGMLGELGYEAGFYDQAHFIKEFKSYTGDTPKTFFRNQ